MASPTPPDDEQPPPPPPPPPRRKPLKLVLRLPSKMAAQPDTTTAAAAQAFDSVMQDHELQNGTTTTDAAVDRDVVMSDSTPTRIISPAILPGATLESYRGHNQNQNQSQNQTPSHNPNTGNLTPARTTAAAQGNTPILQPSLSAQTSNAQERSDSRATSQHPEPVTQEKSASIPKVAAVHGAPTRQYLNGKVTGVLLEGMKIVARDQPKDPLRVLGEYLLQRSREIEGN